MDIRNIGIAALFFVSLIVIGIANWQALACAAAVLVLLAFGLLTATGSYESFRSTAEKKLESEPPEVEVEATFTVSDREVLQQKDFEQMTQAEIDEALRAISRLRLPVPERRTRRYRAARRGPRIDFRASMRRALRPEVDHRAGALVCKR